MASRPRLYAQAEVQAQEEEDDRVAKGEAGGGRAAKKVPYYIASHTTLHTNLHIIR
jgi:hypothetical protein